MWELKCFFDFNKEEKWLEEKAREGYRLKSGGNGFYQFDYIKTPVEINVKIDYRTFNKESEFRYYCSLFEDSGWHHIAGSKWSGSQYFVKARPDAGDDIFSDNLSRAGRYQRVSLMWLLLALVYIPAVVIYFINGYFDLNRMFDWKSLYLTPGLWDLKGFDFLRAFLIETPFALMRGIGWSSFFLIIIMYVYFFLKSSLLYHKELKNKP